MRRKSTSAAVVLALSAALSSVSGAAAQEEEPAPLLTPPPVQFGPDLDTAVITSDFDDPRLNQIVVAAAQQGHAGLGGRNRSFLQLPMPATENVAIAVRDLADPDGGLVQDIVVVSGGDGQATVGGASLNGNTIFLDLDQPLPCITEDGIPDPSGTCAGSVVSQPPNYSAITFAADQAAYLAGIVAAGAARNGSLGIIAALPGCEACERIIEGFTLGARSVRPAIQVDVAYLSDDNAAIAYGDPVTAGSFAEAFINVYEPEVVMALAGASSRGIVEAACEAGIMVVGTEIDVTSAYPNLAECVLTSVVNDYERAIVDSMFGWEQVQPQRIMDLRNGGVDVSAGEADWAPLPGLPVDLVSRVDSARQSIAAGLLDTCPTTCPAGESNGEPGAPDAEASPAASTEP